MPKITLTKDDLARLRDVFANRPHAFKTHSADRTSEGLMVTLEVPYSTCDLLRDRFPMEETLNARVQRLLINS